MDLYLGMRLIEHLWFIYSLLEDCIVHLQPIRRLYGLLYGLFTARQKAIWSIYGLLEGRTVYFIDYK